VAVPLGPAGIDWVRASRSWRKGVRAAFVADFTPPADVILEGGTHGESFVFVNTSNVPYTYYGKAGAPPPRPTCLCAGGAGCRPCHALSVPARSPRGRSPALLLACSPTPPHPTPPPAMVPSTAHEHFGADNYKWLLYGDDDTLWNLDAVVETVKE
jgi:hypothetical protein